MADKIFQTSTKIHKYSALIFIFALTIAIISFIYLVFSHSHNNVGFMIFFVSSIFILLLIASLKYSISKLQLLLREEEDEIYVLEKRNAQMSKALGKLEEVEKIKKNFLLMASHQMRSPLVAIQSVIKVIVSGAATGDEESVRSLLQQAYIRSEDMLDLVNGILDLAEAKVERPENPESIDVCSELQSVIKFLEPMSAEKSIKLSATINPDIPQAQIPKKTLIHIYSNLVENAVKYSPSNTEVKILLNKIPEGILFEVIDQGIGIPESDQDRIFKEFFRADNAKIHAKHGTGLGLAIVHSLVSNLGGEISFTSAQNQGTHFKVILPFSPLPVKPSSELTSAL